MKRLVSILIPGVFASSLGHAQDLNTPRVNSERAMVIEAFPWFDVDNDRTRTGFGTVTHPFEWLIEPSGVGRLICGKQGS